MDMSTLFGVEGIVAVITGGGTGLGFIMAKALANAGAAKVYILGRRSNVLETAASSHPSLKPIVCDVGSKKSLQNAVDIITAETGYVNLVVANSGTFGPSESFDRSLSIQALRKNLFDAVSEEDFTRTYHVNATGVYFTMMAFLELLDAGNKNALQGGFGKPMREGSQFPHVQSQIIVTSSPAGYSRERTAPPAYVSSKAAVTQLAQLAATNFTPYQIRVNTLLPGYFVSEMSAHVLAPRDPEREGVDHPNFLPARRWGTEDDMSAATLYLASKAGAYCNGALLMFDGGRLSVIPSTH
ncbi:short chain dehydrogenase [Xylaria nigripes]|nr:short chain dehydrogenase [Xylaria nigripes]